MTSEAIAEASALQADEVRIPVCVLEMRLDDPANRAEHNPHPDRANVGGYRTRGIHFENAGDGRAFVFCPGNGSDCVGGQVIVDSHDLVHPRMPETSAALGAICTAHAQYLRRGNFLQTYETIDD